MILYDTQVFARSFVTLTTIAEIRGATHVAIAPERIGYIDPCGWKPYGDDEHQIEQGGQAKIYLATDANSGEKGVLKVFLEKFNNSATLTRTQFLLRQNLKLACSVLEPPVDILNTREDLGHYSPFAEGQKLEEFLANPNSTFIESMQLAIAIAHAVGVMHSRQIAHGDLHAGNVIIQRVGSVMHPRVIDLDNFNAPQLPTPPCIGHNLYMAPELRSALVKRQPTIPTIETDLYSLGVLM